MKTHGFICAATSPEYVRLAYLLSLSLKMTHQSGGLTLVTATRHHVPKDWLWAFDSVVEVDQPPGTANFYSRSFFYDLSPYDYTMALDADMVFSRTVDPWWELMSNDRPVVMGEAVTYRNSVITDRRFRAVFDKARLYDAYSACFIFDKSKKSKEMFDLLKNLFTDWNVWRGVLPSPYSIIQPATTDVSLGIATKALNLKSAYVGWRPKFVHLKAELQGNRDNEKVEPKICLSPQPYNYMGDRALIEIGRIKQLYPVHYFHKEWATTERIQQLEESYHALCKV